jgi:hypothetical protein
MCSISTSTVTVQRIKRDEDFIMVQLQSYSPAPVFAVGKRPAAQQPLFAAKTTAPAQKDPAAKTSYGPWTVTKRLMSHLWRRKKPIARGIAIGALVLTGIGTAAVVSEVHKIAELEHTCNVAPGDEKHIIPTPGWGSWNDLDKPVRDSLRTSLGQSAENLCYATGGVPVQVVLVNEKQLLNADGSAIAPESELTANLKDTMNPDGLTVVMMVKAKGQDRMEARVGAVLPGDKLKAKLPAGLMDKVNWKLRHTDLVTGNSAQVIQSVASTMTDIGNTLLGTDQ